MRRHILGIVAAGVAALVFASPTQGQGIIRLRDKAESYSFQVMGDRWASITGLQLEYRVRHGSLLGEPWVTSNFRYWFWGQQDENNLPSISLNRLRSSDQESGDMSISETAEYLGSISFWVRDDIVVREQGNGAFAITYPIARFVELARVTEVDFVGSFEGVLFVGPFSGVHGKPNAWGWNLPDSPSWDRLLVSRRDSRLASGNGRRNVQYETDTNAKDYVRGWREQCTPVCDGEILGLDGLRMNILPIITEIAARSPAFSEAFFGRPRSAQVASLMGAVALEQDAARRAQRERIAQMALDAFRADVDPSLVAAWEVATRDRSEGAAVYEAAEHALCEVETQGRASSDAIAALAQALDRPNVHPVLRERGGPALARLRRGGLGTGDVQITLTWENSADLDLYVREPNGEVTSHTQRQSSTGGQLDVDDTNGYGPENIFWPAGQAPRGNYSVEVNLYSGLPGPFRVRVLSGGEVTEHSGYASGRVGVVNFTFQGAPATTVATCTRLTQ